MKTKIFSVELHNLFMELAFDSAYMIALREEGCKDPFKAYYDKVMKPMLTFMKDMNKDVFYDYKWRAGTRLDDRVHELLVYSSRKSFPGIEINEKLFENYSKVITSLAFMINSRAEQDEDFYQAVVARAKGLNKYGY